MHTRQIMSAGQPLDTADKVLIMFHGRGASARDILGLAENLNVKDYALLAPQATNNTWYPFSFLSPPAKNEPWLSSALALITDIVRDLTDMGKPLQHIYFTGFSQGACLMLEWVTRNAARYGGVAAFTGGLIGDKIYPGNYSGDFAGTPFFLGTSDPDPHVPVERVYASANILKNYNGRVKDKVYANLGHTINFDEISNANEFVFM
jgi:phospholipase/carboxylesterase